MVLYTATIHILLLYVLLIFKVTIFIMQHNIKWNCFFKITVFRKTLSCFYKSTLNKTNGFFGIYFFHFATPLIIFFLQIPILRIKSFKIIYSIIPPFSFIGVSSVPVPMHHPFIRSACCSHIFP